MTRWQKITLASLGIILLTTLGALAYVLLTMPQSSDVLPTPVPRSTYAVPAAAVTARGAYEQAGALARAWQADAVLLSASAIWRKAVVEDLSRPVPWSYQFYSPGTNKLYLVVVRGGQAEKIRESLSPYKLTAADSDQWKVDSHQALSVWLNGGGGVFLQRHPLVDIQARLSVQQGNLAWMVSGTDAIGTDGVDVVVDAALP